MGPRLESAYSLTLWNGRLFQSDQRSRRLKDQMASSTPAVRYNSA